MGRSKRGKKKSQEPEDDWDVSSERSFASSMDGDDFGNSNGGAVVIINVFNTIVLCDSRCIGESCSCTSAIISKNIIGI